MYTAFADLLPTDHPYIRVHNRFWKTFGGANVVLLSVEVSDGDIFNVAVLEKIKKLTEMIEQHSRREQLPDFFHRAAESERRSRHRLGHRSAAGHVAERAAEPRKRSSGCAISSMPTRPSSGGWFPRTAKPR